jgi:hypothetical protein
MSAPYGFPDGIREKAILNAMRRLANKNLTVALLRDGRKRSD